MYGFIAVTTPADRHHPRLGAPPWCSLFIQKIYL